MLSYKDNVRSWDNGGNNSTPWRLGLVGGSDSGMTRAKARAGASTAAAFRGARIVSSGPTEA